MNTATRYSTLLNGTRVGIKPAFVQVGYGQVEPNHLSAQRTGQIYAQLPANPDILVLEQGQFVKYDYAANGDGLGEVNFTGAGEWMLVYNEIKLYRDGQNDCEFAMVKDNYNARVYSPFGENKPEFQSRYYNGKDAENNTSVNLYKVTTDKTADTNKTYYIKEDNAFTTATLNNDAFEEGVVYYELYKNYPYDKVATPANDMYELFQTDDPFNHIVRDYKEKKMHEGTKMVPRVFKTNVGDIFTTNTVNETTLAVGDILAPETKTAADAAPTTKIAGVLHKVGDASNAPQNEAMQWQVVKVYTMPDGQQGVKIMRIA